MKYVWFIKNKEKQGQFANITSIHGVKIAFTQIKKDDNFYYIDYNEIVIAELQKSQNILLKEHMCEACGLIHCEDWNEHLMSDGHIQNCQEKGIRITQPVDEAEGYKFCPICGAKVDFRKDEDGKNIGAECPKCDYKAGDV